MRSEVSQLEATIQTRIEKIAIELQTLSAEIRLRSDYGASSEQYYWTNCLDVVTRIKNQVNKLKEWVRP